jgi:NADPH2:quinone reductase
LVSVLYKDFQQLFEWFNNGDIDPLVSDVYPLEEAAVALRKLMNRQAVGKIVLTTE